MDREQLICGAPLYYPGPEYVVKPAGNVKRALLDWMEAGNKGQNIVYY